MTKSECIMKLVFIAVIGQSLTRIVRYTYTQSVAGVGIIPIGTLPNILLLLLDFLPSFI